MSWSVLSAETEAAPPLRTLVDINQERFLTPGRMVERLAAAAREAGDPAPHPRRIPALHHRVAGGRLPAGERK